MMFDWMLTKSEEHEAIHKSYVSAIAAQAGMSLGESSPDKGIDFIAIPNRYIAALGRPAPINSGISFQLKSTINWSLSRDKKFIKYDLKTKAYNDMVVRNLDVANGCVYSPLILILMCLPKNGAYCLHQSRINLSLAHCCYWYILDKNIVELKREPSTKSIQIPVGNILNVENMRYFANQSCTGWGVL